MGLVGTLLRLFLGRSGGGMAAKLLGGPLLGIVLGMLKRQGGLSGMLDKFKGAGMGQKADSWVSTGQNETLSAEELERALGPEELEQISKQTGLSVEEVREKLANGLPEVINQVTPDGQVPDEGALGGLLDKLGKFLPR